MLEARVRGIAKPPPKLTISEWAALNLMLSAEDSAEPGRYQPNRAPYQKGILDAVSDPLNDGVVVMASAQVGKTLLLKSIIGYYVDQDPSTILILQPTIEMAETFSKDRLAPMVRDTPCLRGKIADPRVRDSGNTILHKRFPGGHLTMVGANSPAGLASRPIRVLLCDEVDRYPPSAGTEGDPINLARARTKTFWNRRIVMVSTPGNADTSRILPAFEASDQRRYFVPCPHCGERQTLKWAHVSWTDDDPASAVYGCEHCGAGWSDGERVDALRAGEWVAEFPGRPLAGFHLNELYSPFRKLREIVADFLTAKGSPELLKTWVNTSLGEPWRDQEGDRVDADVIADRREPYTDAPEGVLLVTLAVDVQDDRLELEFCGWGVGEETWGLEYKVLHGDPGTPELWERLQDELSRTFRRADGAVLTVAGCAIDSAGHFTRAVYEFAKRNRGKVNAMVGRSGAGRALVTPSQSLIKHHGIRLFVVGVDTAKELLMMSRLKIETPGPGYCHWPESYPDNWFTMLTAERRMVVYSHGRPAHRWVCRKGDRNEALDLRVYGLALLHLIRPNWQALAERVRATRGQSQPEPQAPPRGAVRRTRSGGVSAY
jgi:phage terminase large subunit GpA-like protein